MDVVLGGLAGLVTGTLGSLVAACPEALGRRLRDLHRARRDGVPAPSLRFTPYWLLFGLLGLVAGACWTWRLQGTWRTGAIAGAGVPAFATLVFLAWTVTRLRR